MIEKLKIEWHRTPYSNHEGYMELNLDNFFPCRVSDAKQVFKLVKMWCSEDTIKELEEYLVSKEKASIQAYEDSAFFKNYSSISQSIFDKNEMLKNGTHPNGLPISKAERKNFADDVKDGQKRLRKLERQIKSSKTEISKWKRMLSIFYSEVKGGVFK